MPKSSKFGDIYWELIIKMNFYLQFLFWVNETLNFLDTELHSEMSIWKPSKRVVKKMILGWLIFLTLFLLYKVLELAQYNYIAIG